MAVTINNFEALKGSGDTAFPLAVGLCQVEPNWFSELQKGELKIESLISDGEVMQALYMTNHADWIYIEEVGLFVCRCTDTKCLKVFLRDMSSATKQLGKSIYESNNDKVQSAGKTGSL